MVIIASLFLAFSVVAAAILDRNVVTVELDRQLVANYQVSRISRALVLYAAFNGGHYPCPARYNIVYNDVGGLFGTEETTNCNAGAPPAGVDDLGSYVRGMVPIRALVPYGLTIEEAFDPWGSRVMYVVNRNLAVGGDGVPTASVTLRDHATLQDLTDLDFLVISYGKDKMGAIHRSQTAAIVACPDAAAGIDLREENCNNDLNFRRGPMNAGGTATPVNYFDDFISFYRADDCPSGALVSWTVGPDNCSGPLPVLLFNGDATTVGNTAMNVDGSVTVTCNDGALGQSGATCTALPAVNGACNAAQTSCDTGTYSLTGACVSTGVRDYEYICLGSSGGANSLPCGSGTIADGSCP